MRRTWWALAVLIAAAAAFLLWRGTFASSGLAASPRSPEVAEDPPAEVGFLGPDVEAADPPAAAAASRAALAAPAPAYGRLRVHVRLAPDGGALAQVAVHVHALDGRPEFESRRSAVTGADGSAEFAQLAVGPWQVVLDRGPTAEVDVAADRASEVALTVPGGAAALVRVLAADGTRAAGAAVRLWPASGYLDVPAREEGAVVGHTDVRGELRLAGLPSFYAHGSWVAAAHATLGSSSARMIAAPKDADDGSERVIELRLGLPGATLDLRVTGEDGGPIAAAHVQVVPVDQPSSRDDGAGRVLAHLLRGARTDARGRADLGPLPSGEHRLRVQANGFATVWLPLRIDARERVRRDVALAVEARAHGRTAISDGTPVRGADVTVTTAAGALSARSDAAGNFALGGLTAGPARWRATHPSHASVEGACALARGDSTAIEIALAPLAAVRGRIVDADGAALAGWAIAARSEGRPVCQATSAADGTFSLTLEVAAAYALRVAEPGIGLPCRYEGPAEVRAGMDGVTLRVPADARANAYVEGALVDGAGRPAIEGQVLSVRSRDASAVAGHGLASPTLDPATGSFRLGPLPSGTYVLTFASRETVEFRVPGVELLPYATRQLGRLVVPAGGTVRAEVRAEPGVALGDVLLQLAQQDDTHIVRLDPATLSGEKTVLPGRYRATVYGQGFRWLVEDVEVVTGQTATLRGTLRAAARFGLRLHKPTGERTATFVVRDGSGNVAFDAELDADTAFEDSWPFLDRGEFRVEATGASGRLYRAHFAVETLERRTAPLDVRVEPAR